MMVGGSPASIFEIGDSFREYSLERAISLQEWASDPRHRTRIEMSTTPFAAPNDVRALGVILTHVAVVPSETASPFQLALLLPNLLLLGLLYATLRCVGVGQVLATALLGLALVGVAGLAATDRVRALFFAAEAAGHPGSFALTALVLAAVPALTLAPALPDLRASLVARLPRLTVPAGLGEAIWLVVLTRIAFTLFALLTSWFFPLPGPCSRGTPAPVLHASGNDFRLLGVWQRFDACHYEKIATVGYQPLDTSTAFFPLYPLLVRVVSIPLLGNITLAGLVVSALATVAALAGVYRLVAHDFDAETAQRAQLYLAIFPSAFFLLAPFTESLFLALAVWTLYAARRGAWGWVMVGGLLAGLTRPQGCLLLIPLGWEALRWWQRCERKRLAARDLVAALAAMMPVVGLLAFAAYTRVATGWSTFQAQQFWDTAFHTPWATLSIAWEQVGTGISLYGLTLQRLNVLILVLFIGLLIGCLRWLAPVYSLYFAPQLLLILARTSGSAIPSSARYVLVLFPAFVVLALVGRGRRLHYTWLTASLLLLGLLLYTFLSGEFVA